MKNVILFLISMMISQLSFSQIGFPKSILLNNKKSVVITPNQVKALNLLWISFNEQIEINVELTNQISSFSDIIQSYDYEISEKDSIINIKQSRINSKDLLIVQFSNDNKNLGRKNTWLKVQRSGLGALLMTSLGYIVYDLIHNHK